MLSLRRFAIFVVVASILFLLLGSIAITFSGLRDDLHPADLAVVPGSKVNRDGQSSFALQARLDKAVNLYRQGYFKLIWSVGDIRSVPREVIGWIDYSSRTPGPNESSNTFRSQPPS